MRDDFSANGKIVIVVPSDVMKGEREANDWKTQAADENTNHFKQMTFLRPVKTVVKRHAPFGVAAVTAEQFLLQEIM